MNVIDIIWCIFLTLLIAIVLIAPPFANEEECHEQTSAEEDN